ncbi:hypothetical protein ES705_12079 [subsurface metagenome]
MDNVESGNDRIDRDDFLEMSQKISTLKNEISKAFIGQEEMLNHVIMTLLAGGHLLVEGVPGLGKTLLVKALAKAIGGSSNRIQFTPDLMPSDITGHVMYEALKGSFTTRKGPVFTNILIADELNRAPAKTQSALFEAMQEYQVSLDGTTYDLPSPFLTLATQNPFEHEGTYPLPDAQKDRFLMKVLLDYPDIKEEKDMVNMVAANKVGVGLNTEMVLQVLSPDKLIELQQMCRLCRVDESILDYAVRLVRTSREHPAIETGAGPRAGLALIAVAKASAFIDGREYVLPEDVKYPAAAVLRHRIILTPESEIEGFTEDTVIDLILQKTEAPRE